MQKDTLLVIGSLEHKVGRLGFVFIFVRNEWIKSNKSLRELEQEWRTQALGNNVGVRATTRYLKSGIWKKTRPTLEYIGRGTQ